MPIFLCDIKIFDNLTILDIYALIERYPNVQKSTDNEFALCDTSYVYVEFEYWFFKRYIPTTNSERLRQPLK